MGLNIFTICDELKVQIKSLFSDSTALERIINEAVDEEQRLENYPCI